MEKNTVVVVVYLLHSSPTLSLFFFFFPTMPWHIITVLGQQIAISFLSELLYELLSSVKHKRTIFLSLNRHEGEEMDELSPLKCVP